MSWIATIPYEKSQGRLRNIYDRVKGLNGYVDNVLLIHSLRPHTLSGHMALYKSVLHHHANSLPKWYLEAIGVFVSHLNNCDYCVQHHMAGIKRLCSQKESEKLWQAVQSGALDAFFQPKEITGLEYAKMLTEAPDKLAATQIDSLRKAGFDDGEILEINQVSSYFNYVNRVVRGLGVSTEGDILGLSPRDSADQDNWSHE